MFTAKFDRYTCDGDSITCEVDGFTATARIVHDDAASAPWDREDGHGPVTDWVRRGKSPGERVLNQDRNSFRYYDFAEAVKIAKRDGWGCKGGRKEGETSAQYAARAAEEDFSALLAWCRDAWWYVGVCVTVARDDVQLTGRYDHALWDVDCNHPNGDNSYLTEVANELLPEALDAAREKLETLCCGRERITA